MRNYIARMACVGLCIAVSACVTGCGGTSGLTASQVGCISDAALQATSQTLSLTDAQKQAVAAGEAVSFVYCDAATTASAAAAASAPAASQ